jgi:tetratricopeptide (TPR) repeat protein
MTEKIAPVKKPLWPVALMLVFVAGAIAVMVQTLRPAPAPAQESGTAAPGSLDAVLNAVTALKRDAQFAKAETVLQEAISRFPDEQRLYVEYAETLVATQRPQDAYANYERALATGTPTHPIQLAAGSVACMLGKLDRAEEHFAAAQQLDKTDWKAPLFLAQVQIKRGDSAQAQKNLLLSINLKPEAATAWGSLADLELRENKPELAAQHAAKARELEPASTVWRVLEARILKRNNQPEQALAALIGLDATQRLEPGVLQTMAECLGMLSRPAEAAKLYAEASDVQPSRGDVALQAALWWERAGQPVAGLPYAQRASDAAELQGDEVLERLRKAAEQSLGGK